MRKLLIDPYGRTLSYLRISVTDRCSLRCLYCQPQGMRVSKAPMEEILTFAEIREAAEAGAELGIRDIRVTGGEPLARKGCPDLVRLLADIPGIRSVSMTTNGLALKEALPALLEAGLTGVNVSLDTLDRKTYERITGKDALKDVLAGIQEALRLGLPVKINAVLLKDLSLENAFALIDLARTQPLCVRFIEMMPIGAGKDLAGLSCRALTKELMTHYPGMVPCREKLGAGPASYYEIPGFAGKIGMIPAACGSFCSCCTRLRLTSIGALRPCLSSEKEVDVKEILRSGKDRETRMRLLQAAYKRAAEEKPQQSTFGSMPQPECMAEIGG